MFTGQFEMLILGIVAILLFGRKLPEVARSLGSSYRQFKQGLHEIQSQVNVDTYSPPPQSRSSSDDYEDEEYYEEASAPKFVPPPSEPKSEE